jgi:EGF domain-specific O-GlcNAc transferase
VPNVDNGKFQLPCSLNAAPSDDRGSPAPALRSFPPYWYDTGPAFLFRNFINFTVQEAPRPSPSFDATIPTVVLVKREIANFNLWHNLLEIMSVSHTLDIISRHGNFGDMWASPLRDDLSVLILDDNDDGPYRELWGTMSPNPVLRSTDLSRFGTPVNIVVPIPGGANPFWQGDWVDLDCGRSSLLTTFSQRVLNYYNLTHSILSAPSHSLTITIIDRTTKRRLTNQHRLVASVKSALPRHNIQLIDFAPLSLYDQLTIVRNTDILVGVHGAGLTHGMFLPPNSAIVEFMPQSLKHRGFRNMAKMLGHAYRGAKTSENVTGTVVSGDWQQDDVAVDPEAYMHEIQSAVHDVEAMRAKTRSRLDALLDVWG